MHVSTKTYVIKMSDIHDICIDLKHAWNRIHTVPATQGLIKRSRATKMCHLPDDAVSGTTGYQIETIHHLV